MCSGNPSHCSKTSRRIECLLLTLFLTVQLEFALALLPAPVNISVNSINFDHSLLWDPGPGTPPGTQYKIFKWIRGYKHTELLNSTTTSLKLKLGIRKTYGFTIQALYNLTTSPSSKEVFFTPFSDTKIDPLELSLAGCGNCLKIKILLPKPDPHSGINDIQEFYKANFTVSWRKNGNGKLSKHFTRRTAFTLENLEQGAEYCVQVHMNTNLNKNIDPSTLKCILTSPPQTSGSKHLLLGLLFAGSGVVVMIITFCVYYTGFCCKPKVHQPKALTTTPSQYKDTFTPKRAISDCITITSDKGNGKAVERQTLIIFPAAIMEPNSEMENVREEDRSSCYLNKNFQLSLSENSSSGFGPLLDSNNAILEKNLQQIDFKVKSDVEEPVVHLIDTCFHTEDQNPSEQNYEGVKNEEEGELWNNTLNVNLLSVTIAAPVIEIREMEDEDTEPNSTDFSTIQTMETSFAQDSYLKRTLAIP
ncbi:interferon alpha/beta receptor 2-like [Gouania willdenowi]|uniref:Interferon alpha/beta receptor 2-like n=1 Tax=Gouania willdenowi TaxID=441366 RepID=A0A8C5EFV9_GOUWI|nr:interferon alpha/beta receptor 2-like [Gouania willdenowi]